MLLFPDGRLLSHRWCPVAWLAVGAAAMSVVGLAFQPGTLDEDYPSVTNPFGIGGRVEEVLDLISSVGAALATVALLLSLVSMVVRFWRSRVEEHQQIKWIAYAGAIMISAFLLTEVVSGGGLISDFVWAAGFVALAGLPIAVAVAILKYRLYDIDVVINRTLVYGSLTVTLALTYSGSVALLQYLLRTLTAQETQLTVVASTLAIAALFQPLRRRIQEVIDRRLYRRKYDAAKTLEAFGARLREETDLDRLGEEMVTVVRETMQPGHVSLWLKPAQMAHSHAPAAARAGTAQR